MGLISRVKRVRFGAFGALERPWAVFGILKGAILGSTSHVRKVPCEAFWALERPWTVFIILKGRFWARFLTSKRSGSEHFGLSVCFSAPFHGNGSLYNVYKPRGAHPSCGRSSGLRCFGACPLSPARRRPRLSLAAFSLSYESAPPPYPVVLPAAQVCHLPRKLPWHACARWPRMS